MVYRNNTGRLGCWLHQCVLEYTLAGSKTVVSTSRDDPVVAHHSSGSTKHCVNKLIECLNKILLLSPVITSSTVTYRGRQDSLAPFITFKSRSSKASLFIMT